MYFKKYALVAMLTMTSVANASDATGIAVAGKIVDQRTGDVIAVECLKTDKTLINTVERDVCTAFQFVKYSSGREDLKSILSEPLSVDEFISILDNEDQFVDSEDKKKLGQSLISVSKWAYSKYHPLVHATSLAWGSTFLIWHAMGAAGSVILLWPMTAAAFSPVLLPPAIDIAKAPVVLIARSLTAGVENVQEYNLEKKLGDFKSLEEVSVSHKRFLKIERVLLDNY